MHVKTPSDSEVVQSNLVLPNDTNMLNNLMGGRLMHQMDIVAAIAAQRHSDSAVVTASVDNVSFEHVIPLGSIITLKAKVTRAFKTSMEVKVEVFSENIPNKESKFKSNQAFLTFVAVDENLKPRIVPSLTPVTEDELKMHDGALRRRQFRLLLAGKIKPNQAQELKNFLDIND